MADLLPTLAVPTSTRRVVEAFLGRLVAHVERGRMIVGDAMPTPLDMLRVVDRVHGGDPYSYTLITRRREGRRGKRLGGFVCVRIDASLYVGAAGRIKQERGSFPQDLWAGLNMCVPETHSVHGPQNIDREARKRAWAATDEAVHVADPEIDAIVEFMAAIAWPEAP